MSGDGQSIGCFERSALDEVASGILISIYEGKILSPRVIMKETVDLVHHLELLHFAEKISPQITPVSCLAAIWSQAGNDYPATAAHCAAESVSTMDPPKDPDDGSDGEKTPKPEEILSSDEEKGQGQRQGQEQSLSIDA